MSNKTLVGLSVAVILSGCATTTVPNTRKLSPEIAQSVGKADVVIADNGTGGRAAWTSAGAAPANNNYYYVQPGTSPLPDEGFATYGNTFKVAEKNR